MFKSPAIKINEHGIDLISNYQVQNHIDFNEVIQLDLIRSYLLKYWIVFLFTGLAMMIFCAVWGIHSAITYELPEDILSPKAYIAFHLVSPWILFVGGFLWAYQGIRKSPVLMIRTKASSYRIALKEFEKNGSLNNLISFLQDKVAVSNHLESSK